MVVPPPQPPFPPLPRAIKVHPLAIIGISDHHTRIVMGGSAMSKSSPVVGLLFGITSSSSGGKTTTISVIDAEEITYPPGPREDNDKRTLHRAMIRKKIELHRKVFPNHTVVGWYRVSSSSSSSSSGTRYDGGCGGGATALPTEDDLRMTRTEMWRYCVADGDEDEDRDKDDGTGKKGGGGGFVGDGDGPIFLLMDASSGARNDGGGSRRRRPTSSSRAASDASHEMDMDEELPLTIYETISYSSSDGDGGGEDGMAFVNSDFELETYEPERIAVERVFRTRPSSGSGGGKKANAPAADVDGARGRSGGFGEDSVGGDGGFGSRKTGKKSKKEAEDGRRGGGRGLTRQSSMGSSRSLSGGIGGTPRFLRGPTDLDDRLESLESSVRAIHLRISVLCEYLARVERGEVEPDVSLLRSIDGLVLQLPLVLASLEGESSSASSSSTDADSGGGRTPLREIENEHGDAMLLTYLAAIAKTARAVHVYSERFRESGKGDSHRRPLY